MATINIGNLSFTHKGDYDGSTAYVKNDVVYYSTNGNAYIAKQGTTGNAPTNGTYWSQFAAGSGGIWNAGLSLGSAGQVVKVNSGASALEFGTISSNVDLVSYVALDSTGVNTISITTDWATNNYWKMEMFMQNQVDAAQGAKMRVRNASGDITTDSYMYLGMHTYDQTNHSNVVHAAHRDLNGSRTETETNGWGFNASNKNPWIHLTVYKPDPNNRQSYTYDYYANDASSPNYYAWYKWNVWNNNTDAKKGWSMYGNSGSKFKSGFYVVYGYKYQ